MYNAINGECVRCFEKLSEHKYGMTERHFAEKAQYVMSLERFNTIICRQCKRTVRYDKHTDIENRWTEVELR